MNYIKKASLDYRPVLLFEVSNETLDVVLDYIYSEEVEFKVEEAVYHKVLSNGRHTSRWEIETALEKIREDESNGPVEVLSDFKTTIEEMLKKHDLSEEDVSVIFYVPYLGDQQDPV